MDEVVVDPYGGYRETWPQDVLNAASQGVTIAFTRPAVRSMPARDQITFPDFAHYEICGYDEIASGAYACGLVDDVDATIAGLLADARGLKYNPGNGSDAPQLMLLAGRKGWGVELIGGPAGDVGARLLAEGRVGLSALFTSYGVGAKWNTLHPDGGGSVGHWEGVGAINGTASGDQMTPAERLDVGRAFTRLAYLTIARREPESQDAEDGWAVEMRDKGFDTGMNDLTVALMKEHPL